MKIMVLHACMHSIFIIFMLHNAYDMWPWVKDDIIFLKKEHCKKLEWTCLGMNHHITVIILYLKFDKLKVNSSLGKWVDVHLIKIYENDMTRDHH